MSASRLVAPAAGAFLSALVLVGGWAVVIMLAFYLFFLVDAIVMSGAGPIRAAINSARVVANNFSSTVGFIALVYLISVGLQIVWGAMSKNPFGIAVAIVGNAYVASGLAAASMQYYQTRVSRLPAGRGIVAPGAEPAAIGDQAKDGMGSIEHRAARAPRR